MKPMLRWPFGGLYWRLIASYVLVALVAVLAVTAYTSLSPVLASVGGPTSRSPLDALPNKGRAPELASYLEQSPPDRGALNGWAWSLLVGVRIPLGAITVAQIRDAGGQVLAATAAPGVPTQALLATPEAQAVLGAAQAGDQRPEDLRRTLADGQTVLAVPIVPDAPGSRVVGVFFAACTGTSFPPSKVFSAWLASYLTQRPPNQDALHGWLWAVAHAPGVPAGSLSVTPGALLVEVLDASGTPLATASAPGVQEQALLADARAQTAIRGALAGSRQSSAARRAGAPAQVVDAMPIRAYDGRIIGALAVAYDPSSASILGPDVGGIWADFVSRLTGGFVFLLLATLIATLSGALIALTVRRRLRRITAAADAWSRGELEIAVRDRSHDEIGQLARHLNAMADQLRALLTARQELAVVEERNRLARDLHDSVKQHVFATALLVRSARKQLARSPAAAAAHLDEAEALAGQTQEELLTLIRALRPAAIADRGLVAVLRDYLADWSRRTGIAVAVRVQGERATPLDIEEALYRVAQEALANVARHSQATAVELRLGWEGDALHLAIEDNGQGFDATSAAGGGLGLASMRERVEALQGSLAVGSAPGATTVEAEIPLAVSHPATTAETKEAPHVGSKE